MKELKLKDTGDNERIATIIDRIAMRTTYACTQEEKALLKKYGIKRRGKSLVFNAEYLPFQGGCWSDKRFKCDYVNWISTRGTREYAKKIRWYKYGARSFQGAEREYESKHPPKMFEKYKKLKETIECEKENRAALVQAKEERHNAIMKRLKSSDEFYSGLIKETIDRIELARSAVRELKAK